MDTRTAGAMGGKSRSAAKRASSARNLEKARAARMAKRTAPAQPVSAHPASVGAAPGLCVLRPMLLTAES